MLVIQASSPNSALAQALKLAEYPHLTKAASSRNGPVLRFNRPVTTMWTNPINRILWSPVRDCNPFLHLIESAWMLAGRNDVATVAKLAAQMNTYTDDGSTLNGAYGYRWRNHFEYDQIAVLIKELRANRETRRIVLQMWDGLSDLKDAIKGSKDVPCNTAIYFDPIDNDLHMTVTNRSNDAIWGCYGANLVHMSILHEYVARLTGFEVGNYYQVSNNLHFYTENEATKKLLHFNPETNRAESLYNEVLQNLNDHNTLVNYGFVGSHDGETLFHDLDNEDVDGIITTLLDRQIQAFVDGGTYEDGGPYFMQLVGEMMKGFNAYKKHGPNVAVEVLEDTQSLHSQWIVAAILWLKRRPSYKPELGDDSQG